MNHYQRQIKHPQQNKKINQPPLKTILSTAWYPLGAKFPEATFHSWIHNMLSRVKNYYLVVYTNTESLSLFSPYLSNPRIHIVVKPIEEWTQYENRIFWQENHTKNVFLNQKIDWKLNMLWSEKVHFVWNTIMYNYFVEDAQNSMYGWIDIGYFRGRPVDTELRRLTEFPNPSRIRALDPTKIHYALVNNKMPQIQYIEHCVQTGQPIHPQQISVGGGCFFGTKEKIEEWRDVFTIILQEYIDANKLVKDDQIIVAEAVFSLKYGGLFYLHREVNPNYDNWFMFSRLLL